MRKDAWADRVVEKANRARPKDKPYTLRHYQQCLCIVRRRILISPDEYPSNVSWIDPRSR